MRQCSMTRKVGRPSGQFKYTHPVRINGKVTKTYQAWQSMNARCYGNHPASKHYKARGIKVCDRWRGAQGYQHFLDDIGIAPEGLWLDRIDNDGNYEPNNVRWTTTKISAMNRHQGGGKNKQPMSLMSICEALGKPYARIYQRIKLHNWTYLEAFTYET